MAHNVVLVDDQVLFVESLRNVIQSRAEDFTVVDVFYDADSALGKIVDINPELVLMDVRMPGRDGVHATAELLRLCPSTKVMMLTTYDDDEYVAEAVRLGAVGYLLKDMPPETLIACMRAAVSGQFQIPSKHASRVFGESKTDGSDLPDWLLELSRKERRILRLVVEGYENDEIAQRVYLAAQTVKNYISRMYGKADVTSRVQLIRLGRKYSQYL